MLPCQLQGISDVPRIFPYNVVIFLRSSVPEYFMSLLLVLSAPGDFLLFSFLIPSCMFSYGGLMSFIAPYVRCFWGTVLLLKVVFGWSFSLYKFVYWLFSIPDLSLCSMYVMIHIAGEFGSVFYLYWSDWRANSGAFLCQIALVVIALSLLWGTFRAFMLTNLIWSWIRIFCYELLAKIRKLQQFHNQYSPLRRSLKLSFFIKSVSEKKTK